MDADVIHFEAIAARKVDRDKPVIHDGDHRIRPCARPAHEAVAVPYNDDAAEHARQEKRRTARQAGYCPCAAPKTFVVRFVTELPC